MDQQTLVTILLGGLGGAIVAEVIQILREGAAHRRLVRGAARVLRTEIISNSGLVMTALQMGGIPDAALWTFRNDRFDRQIDVLVAELSRTDVGILLAFDSMHVVAKGILEKMQAGNANAADVEWLQKKWGSLADLCQVMMDFKGGRWWEPMRHPRMWLELRRRRRDFDKDAAAAQAL